MLMTQDTAGFVGTKGANFPFSIDAGMIPQNGGALLIVGGQADQKLVVAASGREVTVPNLPSGDSTISLALVWAPGETNDATIDVGTVTTGTVTAAVPKHTIDNGDRPGFVELFGKVVDNENECAYGSRLTFNVSHLDAVGPRTDERSCCGENN